MSAYLNAADKTSARCELGMVCALMDDDEWDSCHPSWIPPAQGEKRQGHKENVQCHQELRVPPFGHYALHMNIK
jgi:hypothetical protein